MTRNLRRASLLACVLALLALALAACGSSGAGAAGKGTTVNVIEKEYAIIPSATRAPAGSITFKVHNTGVFTHEFSVARYTDAAALPKKSDGTVNEGAIPASKEMGRIAGVEPETVQDLTVDLPAGTYVLFCNRVDGKTSHFRSGMHTVFAVVAS